MNALDRIAAVTVKEFRHLGRDPRSLIMVLLLPVAMMLLFGYAISFDVTHVPTVVVDNDRTPASRDYLAHYEGSPFFTIVERADELRAIDQAFGANRARIGVVVPAGFERSLATDTPAEIAVLIDGTEPTAARVAQAYTTALNQLVGQQLTLSWADAKGYDLTAAGVLEPRVRTWYNPERRSAVFLIPGLMVAIISIVTIQQTAVSLVRERDLGTADQLAVSPIRMPELMLGKLLPWTVLAFLEVVAITAVAIGLFAVPLHGDPLLLIGGAALFVFCCLGMGLVISAVAPSVDVANILALMVAFLPAFLLSGFIFPLDQIPTALQWVSAAFPARYMVDIARGIFLKASGWTELWPQFAALAAYAVLALLLASVLYRRRSA